MQAVYEELVVGQAMSFAYRPRVTFAGILSFFDIRVVLNKYLRKTDLARLARCSKHIEEDVELMMALHWYECPRITYYTNGSLDHDVILDCWDQMTFHGSILPMSDGLHSKLLRTPHLRAKLSLVTLHSRVWMDNEAFGFVVRFFATIFIGTSRRDGDVIHDVTHIMAKFLGQRREVNMATRRGVRERTSWTRCIDGLHSDREEADLLMANSKWWFKVVLRYIVANVRELRKPYEIDDTLTVGDVCCLKIGKERLARVECFRDFVYAKELFELAEPLAVAAVSAAFM